MSSDLDSELGFLNESVDQLLADDMESGDIEIINQLMAESQAVVSRPFCYLVT